MTRLLIAVLLLAFPASAAHPIHPVQPIHPAHPAQQTSGEWVQLTLSGQITEAGGARIEIEVGAVQVRGELESRQVSLSPHLAPGTNADDVAALLAQRLERANFDVWLSESRSFDGRARRHLFIEHALFLRLRLGHGLSASVTVCEGTPTSMRIQPPNLQSEGARLILAFSTLHAHTGDQGRQELSMPLDFDMHAAQISSELTRRCLERKWTAERPRLDTWRLVQMGDGARIAGFSVELQTTADWRLELEFAR